MIKKILHKLLEQLSWKSIRLRGRYICTLIRLMGGICLGLIYADKGLLFKYPPHWSVDLYGELLILSAIPAYLSMSGIGLACGWHYFSQEKRKVC